MTYRASNLGSERSGDFGEYAVPRWKRALDITCILLVLPVLLPLLGLVALAVKFTSPGPLLFVQKRVGYRRTLFACYKFRSMKCAADTSVHQQHLSRLIGSGKPMMKLDNQGDSRLTRIGLLLRSTGLDELPQLFNVLRGDMSLVGPRPCLPYEYKAFCAGHQECALKRKGTALNTISAKIREGHQDCASLLCETFQLDRFCYKERSNVLPGLTGLWQVSGKNHTTFEEMMRLDIYYARHSSLWLDLKIIVKTIPALITQAQEAHQAKLLRSAAATMTIHAGRNYDLKETVYKTSLEHRTSS
jgi:exopolysaccharide production protein ExoY